MNTTNAIPGNFYENESQLYVQRIVSHAVPEACSCLTLHQVLWSVPLCGRLKSPATGFDIRMYTMDFSCILSCIFSPLV